MTYARIPDPDRAHRPADDRAGGLRPEPQASQPKALIPCAFADAVRILEAHWYSDAELAEWLNAAHPQFAGLSALQMLSVGKKAEVLACVQRLDDGVYL
jgi:hypothetical protein